MAENEVLVFNISRLCSVLAEKFLDINCMAGVEYGKNRLKQVSQGSEGLLH